MSTTAALLARANAGEAHATQQVREAAVVVGGYRADIDGLRAFAVLAVLLFHAFPRLLPGGFVGVDVFFVISGYLISTILLNDIVAGRFTFRRFYVRRIRRIFPALLLVLVACSVVGWVLLFEFELRELSGHVIAGALSVANIKYWKEAGYFDSAKEFKPLLHLWSLGVEEQYYLAWPVALFVTRARTHWVRALMLVTIVGSFLVNVAFVDAHPTGVFYLPITRLWELGLGSLLASWVVLERGALASREHASARLRDALSVGGCALLVAAVWLVSEQKPFPGWWALLPTLGAALLIAAGPQAWFNRHVFAARPLVQLGLISYPLYLWHWPLLSYARIVNPDGISDLAAASLLVAAVGLAWLTYRFVERPIRTAANASRLALRLLMCTSVIIAASCACYAGLIPARVRVGSELVANTVKHRAAIHQAAHELSCDGHLALSPLVQPYCRMAEGPKGAETIVLWGDSHASAWAPAIFALGRERGYRVVVISHEGCAPLLGVRRSDLDAVASCRVFGLGEAALASIAALRPAHVFLAARWSVYAHGWHIHGRLQSKTHFLTKSALGIADEASSREALSAQLSPTVAALSALAPVTLIKTVPILGASFMEAMNRGPDQFEPTLAQHRALEAFTDALLDAAALRFARVTVLDPARVLCPRQKCMAALAGTVLYADDNHLTEPAALLFEKELLSFLPQPR